MSACKECGTEFNPDLRHPNQLYCGSSCNDKAYYRRNKAKINAGNLANYYKTKPACTARRKENRLKNVYGLTPDQWREVFEEQGSCCATCRAGNAGSKIGWHTDHDHKTGKFRGILCHGCNIALGAAKDSAGALSALAAYVQRNEHETTAVA